MISKRIASYANDELILKSSISDTCIHSAVGIARDNSETFNQFPFVLTSKVLYSIGQLLEYSLYLPVTARFARHYF